MLEELHAYGDIEEKDNCQDESNPDTFGEHVDDGVYKGFTPGVPNDDYLRKNVRFLQRRRTNKVLMHLKVRLRSCPMS